MEPEQYRYLLVFLAYGAIAAAFIIRKQWFHIACVAWGFGIGVLVTVFFV